MQTTTQTKQITEIQFNSPSRGRVNFADVIYDLVSFMEEDDKAKYRLIIGTDSKSNNGCGKDDKDPKDRPKLKNKHKVEFITAVAIHRLGKGGRYFWHKETKEGVHTLRQKIYEETGLSLAMAPKIIEGLNMYLAGTASASAARLPEYELEIHVDIGQAGPTRDMIKEIVGMVNGFGFCAKTKPESYAASKVADKHT